MAHALSDSQVSAELEKMVSFIKQEALEKAREIEIKADEEFNIEKAKLVRQEIAAIDASYERKFKQAELAQQIARSNVTNKTRLKILAYRQEMLDGIFEKARGKLREIEGDREKFQGVLKNLILEGLYSLGERMVKVQGREKDIDLLEKAAKDAEEEYKTKTGDEITVDLDKETFIPEESAGGVIILGLGGKIVINNTLEERLRLMETEALPAVRYTLFGSSPNRKFFD